ncbi:hypothetical protein [Lentibacillus saliphilus]|uniref:hypothetical protein n=1 Tax=Lentibacillus saliphilus TaxID=2737028 RepID=UPI001C310454|nr:hypothetical protein [Lentibacillus saliphilus]
MADRKDQDKQQAFFEDKDGVASVQNQLNESYQSGVVEDQLHNNRGIYTFNNQKK